MSDSPYCAICGVHAHDHPEGRHARVSQSALAAHRLEAERDEARAELDEAQAKSEIDQKNYEELSVDIWRQGWIIDRLRVKLGREDALECDDCGLFDECGPQSVGDGNPARLAPHPDCPIDCADTNPAESQLSALRSGLENLLKSGSTFHDAGSCHAEIQRLLDGSKECPACGGTGEGTTGGFCMACDGSKGGGK